MTPILNWTENGETLKSIAAVGLCLAMLIAAVIGSRMERRAHEKKCPLCGRGGR